MDNIVHAPPCIDPLSVKNLELRRPVRRGARARATACAPNDPLLVQVSRFDPWKDPVGVIEAFRIVREEFPTRSSCSRDRWRPTTPRASTTGSSPNEARAGDPDIHLLSNIQQVGSVQINAFQRAADVVIQKSLREGFGLTVSEGLWKGRPVVGGRCGGITLQIDDGVNGYLVDDVEADGERAARLLARPRPGRRDGRSRPRDTCAATSCSTRELEDWLRLFRRSERRRQ